MALSTFGGITLPPMRADSYDVSGTFGDDYVQPEFSDGVIDMSGTDPYFQAFATITGTFVISAAYLQERGYAAADYGSLETAAIDFAGEVLDGGLQTLTDALPANTKLGISGAFVSQRTVKARAAQSYTAHRSDSATIEITVTFLTHSPYWTYNDGAASKVRIL